MPLPTTRSLATVAAIAVLGLGGAAPAAFAKHGADDPVTHDAGDDHGGGKHARRADDAVARTARHHHHRRHGRHHDDGPNHR